MKYYFDEKNFVPYNRRPIQMTYFVQADLFEKGVFVGKGLVSGHLDYDSAVRYCKRRNPPKIPE